MNEFSASGCIKFGWETFKKRPWFLIGATLVYGIVNWAIGAIVGALGHAGIGATIGANIVSWLASILISMGWIAFFLKAHDDVQQVTLNELWHPQPYMKYLGAYLLAALAFVGGIILLIVPGIIFGLMFMFSQYIVIEQNTGSVEALKESKRITDGHKMELFALAIAFILIALAGVLCLVVGLLVAMPVIMLSTVHAYRVLRGMVLPAAASAQSA